MRTRIIAGLAIVLTALALVLDNWVWLRLQRETADERKLTRFPWPGTRACAHWGRAAPCAALSILA